MFGVGDEPSAQPSDHEDSRHAVEPCERKKKGLTEPWAWVAPGITPWSSHRAVHASWLNQVEIYFSIIQRKVLTPNDFATLDAVRLRLALYEQLSNGTPRPFAWKFTRQDLLNWLKRVAPHFLAASAA